MRVERVTPQDWPALKALRLEALADTPIAYLETLDEALALPEENWRARAVRGSVGGDSCQVMAWSGAEPLGTLKGFLDPERPGTAVLAAVYVAPQARGSGLLEALVDPVVAWSRERGCTVLRLWVHSGNGRARAAYARLGFVPTGQTMAYPLDLAQRELALERGI